jgi:hypothetical protein
VLPSMETYARNSKNVRLQSNPGCGVNHPTRTQAGAMMRTGMIFTSPPPDGPARRAWSILSVLLGHVLELRFVQEHNGDPAGFWRVRYYDSGAGTEHRCPMWLKPA